MTGYRKFSRYVWAVVRKRSGEIAWTMGSSTRFPKMMVYQSEVDANLALRNTAGCEVKMIYAAKFNLPKD